MAHQSQKVQLRVSRNSVSMTNDYYCRS